MKFGRGFSVPQDDDLRFMDPWVPMTPNKLILAKGHPIPVDHSGNLLQGANWQQQLTGISREHVPVSANYNGMNQDVSPNGQLLRNGGQYSYDGSLAEENLMINHFGGPYNAGSFTQLVRGDFSCWNNNPMTQLLHDKAAYVPSANMNLERSVDIAANTPLIPKLHPQLGNQGHNLGSYLLTKQNCSTSYPSSNMMSRSLVMDFPSPVDNSRRDSNSFHWLFGNQNYCSSLSSNLLSNGDSSSQISQHGFLPNYDLNSFPSTEGDTASGVAGQLQFTTNEAKNLENDQLSAMLKSLTDESARKEKGKQVLSIEDEATQKNADGRLQNIVESSSAAISTLYNKNKESGRGGDRGIDLNKTPQQKPPKRRKHRPKVIVEGKPKRTPKPTTPKNTESEETRLEKRKYARKNVQKESPTQLAEVTRETAGPTAGKSAKSCRRVLHFDLEKTVDENLCREIGQQENKRTFDLNFDSQGTHAVTETNQVLTEKAAERSVLLNELMVDKHIPSTKRNPIPSMSLMPNNYTFRPESQASASLLATVKDMHLKNSHVMRKCTETANSDLCLRKCRDEDTPVQQHTHAEGIGQDVIRAEIRCENLQKTKENVNQGDSLLKILSLPSEGRGSKREFFRTAEHPFRSTNNPPSPLSFQEILQLDRIQKNSGTPSKDCSGSHKKKKVENGHLSISNMPSKVTAVEKCLGKVDRTGENNVNSNGFASKNHKILSSYFENNKMIDRENKGISKFTTDRYAHSITSGNGFLHRPISSKSNSCQGSTQVLSFSTHSPSQTCNQLASSPPKKSFQLGTKLVSHDNMSAKKQAGGTTVSKISSGTDKVRQEKDASYDYQQPSAIAIGFPIRTKSTIPIDDIIHQFNGLNLNGSCSEILEQENALVPYEGDGAIVPFKGIIKKRKSRPRVELDPETNRIWNLLMGKEGSEGVERTDNEKEKHWEDERKIFQGRVDSFIARMHLVQGDRRFSKWKGSVVDSVIGVFLTQNVSDHLSSSAFMSLAARFPLQSSNHQAPHKVGTNILVNEPEVRMTSPDDATKWHKDASSQPIYCQISRTLHESAENQRDSENSLTERNLDEAHSQCFEEEFVSSQDSIESSVTQGAVGIRSYQVSNSETEDPITGCQPNKIPISISTYQQMEKVTMFQDFYRQVNGSSLLDDGSKNAQMEYSQIKTRLDKINHLTGSSFTNPINLDNENIQVPVVPSSNNQLHMYPNSGEPEPWRFGNFSEDAISSWPSTASTFNIEHDKYKNLRNEELLGSVVNSSMQQNGLRRSQEMPPVDPYALFRQHSIDLKNSSETRPSTGHNPSNYSHQRRENLTFQLESTSVREPENHAESLQRNKSVSMQHVENVGDLSKKSFNVVDGRQIQMKNQSIDSNVQEQLYSYGQSQKETSKKSSKRRKGKTDSEKKNDVNWDILRKQVQANGRKKERNKDATDSLDYEALKNANVKEISEAIKERGMNIMLAERIQEFLNRLVREHGSIDLEWLRDVPPDKAKDYLLSIRGLGLKSVECVRLLTLHHLAFPVDTNVGRIAVRLGWVPLQPLPESLQLHLLEMYPMLESIQKYLWPRLCKLDQRTLYELHYQMITFGKVFCTKSKPNCNACPMRGECRHFASAFASARFALPGPEEKSIVSSSVPIAAEINPTLAVTPMSLPPPEINSFQIAGAEINNCEPIIEEPASPEQEFTELSQSDIEDLFYEDPDEIPTIKLNMEQFTSTLQNYMQEKMELQEGDMSKALVALTSEAAFIPTPKLKNVSRLRTEHQVYEIPDSHPLLKGMDRREPDDPSPYLLSIWTPGETANSIQPPESRCGSKDQHKLCNEKTCFSCNSIREEKSQTVRGTILIPCRTAMRGSFPLNGTYFQVNEMFADHESSHNPIDVPRGWIWNLPRRTVYFGTSVSTIFRGLSTEGIQYCFWRGYVCVRGFERKTRAPRPLMPRLHFPASKLSRTQNEGNKQH
ncbi:transcriptional activator DEMETER-like [Pyrus ussuriensis x Pyrus communis]|uniref:Transcriptional activator DEMETER-like n=1 Tax=Pyrus ussuriensis x Pyrus communis TaxID=2448454 RepID=A0A5N5EVM2_9ROSA|nr:transcriptional activator DEMETER-like [Pyrus ussuriensis x Pyrus communis]